MNLRKRLMASLAVFVWLAVAGGESPEVVQLWAGVPQQVALPGVADRTPWELRTAHRRYWLEGQVQGGFATVEVPELPEEGRIDGTVKAGGVTVKVEFLAPELLKGVEAAFDHGGEVSRRPWTRVGVAEGAGELLSVTDRIPAELRSRVTVMAGSENWLAWRTQAANWTRIELLRPGVAGDGLNLEMTGGAVEFTAGEGGAALAVLTDAAGRRLVLLAPVLDANLADAVWFWVWLHNLLER